MRPPTSARHRPFARGVGRESAGAPGFTLIELLTVLAVVGILSAVVLPSLTGARAAAARARTRVQFAQWAMAVAAFRDEYGVLPVFDPSDKVNGGAAAAANGPHPFFDVLAGRRRDGSALPLTGPDGSPETQNTRHLAFIEFGANDLFSPSAESPEQNLLHDAFENTALAVPLDKSGDGLVSALDYPFRPSASPPDDPGVRLVPSDADFPLGAGGGVRAAVLFYCAPPHARTASDLILSWR